MKKIVIFLMFFTLLGVRSPSAAYLTGENLATYCTSDKDAEVMSCANYIAGVIDYHIFLQSIGAVAGSDFCIPDNVKIEEISFKVMKYLQNSPQDYGFIAAPAVVMALGQAYPCGKAK